jgi:uncharacterized membrane protein YsdA (DUF1294 family)
MMTVLLIYAAVSSATFVAYAFDKQAAISGGRRISEGTLHLLELCGGCPGALIAQQVLRHKCAKGPYQVVFWFIVLLHAAGWTIYLVAT